MATPGAAKIRPCAARPDGRFSRIGPRPRLVGGSLVLEGALVDSHMRAIECALRTNAADVAVEHPEARILEWRWGAASSLTVTTTTDHLAYKLGNALRQLFGGRLYLEARDERGTAYLRLRLA